MLAAKIPFRDCFAGTGPEAMDASRSVSVPGKTARPDLVEPPAFAAIAELRCRRKSIPRRPVRRQHVRGKIRQPAVFQRPSGAVNCLSEDA